MDGIAPRHLVLLLVVAALLGACGQEAGYDRLDLQSRPAVQDGLATAGRVTTPFREYVEAAEDFSEYLPPDYTNYFGRYIKSGLPPYFDAVAQVLVGEAALADALETAIKTEERTLQLAQGALAAGQSWLAMPNETTTAMFLATIDTYNRALEHEIPKANDELKAATEVVRQAQDAAAEAEAALPSQADVLVLTRDAQAVRVQFDVAEIAFHAALDDYYSDQAHRVQYLRAVYARGVEADDSLDQLLQVVEARRSQG